MKALESAPAAGRLAAGVDYYRRVGAALTLVLKGIEDRGALARCTPELVGQPGEDMEPRLK